MPRTPILLLTLALQAAPLQAAETLLPTPAAPIRLAAATDPMIQIRRDQYWNELETAFKAGDWKSVLTYMRKLDALGAELPEEYAYMKATALLESGDAAGAEEQAMRYLHQAGAGGAHYKEALRLLTQAENARKNARSNEPEMVAIPGRNYEIGKYEVTQAQWRAVMGNNPSRFKGCDTCPVENVNWHEAQAYLTKLNQMTGKQ